MKSILSCRLRTKTCLKSAFCLQRVGSLLTVTRCSTSLSEKELASEPYIYGESSACIESMFENWMKDKCSVHDSWAEYFSNVSKGVPAGDAYFWNIPNNPSSRSPTTVNHCESKVCTFSNEPSTENKIKVIEFVRAYQQYGHVVATVDPLNVPRKYPFCTATREKIVPNLDLTYYGFSKSDINRLVDCRVQGFKGFLNPNASAVTLQELFRRLKETYCGDIGVEYMHILDQEACNFIREKMETIERHQFSKEKKKQILIQTARAQMLENFCHSKFATSKRFGLDGVETMIVGMKAIIQTAARLNVDSIVIGMAHRGRLNVLVNVMHKPFRQVMSELQGVTGFGNHEWGNTGDVKYHLGVETVQIDKETGKSVHMSVLPNPSHLEAVNPVALGQARAQQYYCHDTHRERVLPVLLHGDASIAGQGVIYETLQMSNLPSYTVGGTIHIVVNNQVGFTTYPGDAGSGQYCTDIAKTINAPVFHVNADNPEAVTFVCQLAMEYRQRFHNDVFVDIVGYRRFGHNELDMPRFTQPVMYNIISTHRPVLETYSEKLIQTNVVTAKDVEDIKQNILQFYAAEYEKSKCFTFGKDVYSPQWRHMAPPVSICPPRVTGVPLSFLVELGVKISTLPANLNAHPTIAKIFKARLEACESGENVDFGLAEVLAYASLLSDGFHIRLSGQDIQRGTFSHRHARINDQSTGEGYSIFDPLESPQKIEVNNSLLSEFAALGYEVGYALENPDTLVVWEAQFGDFANGAQIIIDQFIASGETKWNHQCGVVLMLPHGYDGQGPEHSSARLERFLQLCDDREEFIDSAICDSVKSTVIQRHNIQVVNCTVPSNTFHVLRRQMHRGFRKPLIIMSPKKMLKLRASFSALSDLSEDSSFQQYIPDVSDEVKAARDKVERLVLCSGQVYYDLAAYRSEKDAFNCAVSRVEQISPFPFQKFLNDVKQYPNLKSVVWSQEEPMNAGAWTYVSKRMESTLQFLKWSPVDSKIIYAGRDCGASTAVGDSILHKKELNALLTDAFDVTRTVHSFAEKYRN